MRSILVTLAVVVLAACADDAQRPDAAEKVRRAEILGPVLLGREVETTEAAVDDLTCIVDQAARVDDVNFRAGFSDVPVDVLVAGELTACHASEWEQAAELLATITGDPVQVAELMAAGRTALE